MSDALAKKRKKNRTLTMKSVGLFSRVDLSFSKYNVIETIFQIVMYVDHIEQIKKR